MQVIKRITGYAQDPTRYFEFGKLADQAGDFVLIEAAFEEATLWDHFKLPKAELKRILKKKIVRLEFEEPNKFFIGDNPDHYDQDFYRIYTLCPYTTAWLNKKHKTKKRTAIYFPFNDKFTPAKTKKLYDIIYTGHIVSPSVGKDITTISKFNYRLVSNSDDPLVTNKSASYEEKMELIAQTKITLVHNLLYPKLYHIFNIWRIPDYYNNEAFKLIPRRYELWKLFNQSKIVVPQLKSRVFEAAFGRSLILCKKDEFNIIEKYFKPNHEFVYFEEGKLEEKIADILKNYKKYQKISDNAYKRAVKEYSTKAFFKKYLKNLV